MILRIAAGANELGVLCFLRVGVGFVSCLRGFVCSIPPHLIRVPYLLLHQGI